MKQMHFVTFHCDSPVGLADERGKQFRRWRQYDPSALIQLMFASARLFHAQAKAVVLSDETTAFAFQGDVRIVRGPVKREEMMLSRMKAQRDYLLRHAQSEEREAPLVFLDGDILLHASLEELWALPFDVGLTLLDDKHGMPINGGAMFVGAGRAGEAALFWTEVIRVYENHHGADALWWGDQNALNEWVGRERVLAHVKGHGMNPPPVMWDVGGVAVALLPCARYNCYYDSYPNIKTALRPKTDVALLHFLLRRKKYMRDYFDAFLAPSSDAASRRRRWQARARLWLCARFHV